ncbi:MAG: phosphatidate cytidylyltransferase [Chlorobi bacterium]|nr:phosphatidate cytidylyltransferase [Chlorobiota bacterium]
MKDIQVRTITGIIFLVTVIGSILLHPLAFLILFAFFTIVGMREFYLLQKIDLGLSGTVLYYISGLAIYFLIAFIGLGYVDVRNLVVGIPIIFLQIVFGLYNQQKPDWKRIGSVFSAIIFVVVPFGLMNSLFYSHQIDGLQSGILIGMFVIIWTNDVFAYLTGSKFGRHKLFEKHSPKKSWEGSVGGFVFAQASAYIMSIFYPQLSIIDWLVLAAIISVSGTYGDLAESLLKRNAGVKDSGNIFPGHGGVLDRFDAVLFATPFVFVYLNLI